jgi:conjugative transfer region protein (TIGR03748 family)
MHRELTQPTPWHHAPMRGEAGKAHRWLRGFSVPLRSPRRDHGSRNSGPALQLDRGKNMRDPSSRSPRRTLIATVLLSSVCLASLPAGGAEEVTVGRYSTLRAVPTDAQADLLAAIVQVTFPESVTTVGEAVRHLLRASGYRLAEDAVAEPARATLLRLPLPGPHRRLGRTSFCQDP